MQVNYFLKYFCPKAGNLISAGKLIAAAIKAGNALSFSPNKIGISSVGARNARKVWGAVNANISCSAAISLGAVLESCLVFTGAVAMDASTPIDVGGNATKDWGAANAGSSSNPTNAGNI